MDGLQVAADRRATVLRVARAEFLRAGYTAANMDEVARAALMSKKTLYKLFPSKAALFEAVMDDVRSPLDVGLDVTGLSDQAALAGLLEQAARMILTEESVGLFRLVCAEAHRVPELAEAFHRAGPARCKGAVAGWLAERATEGVIVIDDATETAGMLFGMALGERHFRMLLGLAGPPDAHEIAGRVGRTAAIFLDGARIRR